MPGEILDDGMTQSHRLFRPGVRQAKEPANVLAKNKFALQEVSASYCWQPQGPSHNVLY